MLPPVNLLPKVGLPSFVELCISGALSHVQLLPEARQVVS